MKKVLLLAMLAISLLSFGQQTKSYLSLSTGVSNAVSTSSLEVGIYNPKIWYGLGVSSYIADKREWQTSIKGYYRIANSGIFQHYFYTAINMGLSDYKLSVEPGLVAVLNLKGKIAPAFALTFPIYENQSIGTLPPSFSIGINYWLN